MSHLIDSKNTWALVFGILGNIISLIVFFSPLPTFIQIYKKKATGGFQSLPYLVSLFSAMLWLYYAFIQINTFLLITINSVGCVIQLFYTLFFIAYAPKKARRSTLMLLGLMNVGLFSLILVVTLFAIDASVRVQVVGWVCTTISTCVFAAPLSIVVRVVRTKSVEFMPFPLSLCLTVSAIMWFAYGFFQKDICVAIPNVLGFILGMLQMGLYGRYRKKEEKVAVAEPLKNIVILTTVATVEVVPEDEAAARNGNNTPEEEEAQHCPV